MSTLRSCYKYRWCLASYPGSSPGYKARWCLLGIINYRDTVYCFSIHWYGNTLFTFTVFNTENISYSPASGNSKWEELHSADKHRGHCCPGNKPSCPRTTCTCKLKYNCEALKDFSSYCFMVQLLYTCTHDHQFYTLVLSYARHQCVKLPPPPRDITIHGCWLILGGYSLCQQTTIWQSCSHALTLFMIAGCSLRGIHGLLIAVLWIFIQS